MSQYLLPTIDPSINTGSQLSVWLNLWAQAVQTQQMGASRPVDATAGMIWIKDVSPVLQQLMVFDGADDLELLNWNPSTNVVSYPGAVKGPASSDIYNIATWGGDNGDTLLDSGFEIQSSVTDAATNKVMRVGAFGLGGNALPMGTTSLDTLLGQGTRFVSINTADVVACNAPSGAKGGTVQHINYSAGNAAQIYTQVTGGTRQWIRFAAPTWGSWVEIWTGANLVKQTNELDNTAGSVLLANAFGMGEFIGAVNIGAGGSINNLTKNGFYKCDASVIGSPSSLLLGFNLLNLGGSYSTQMAWVYGSFEVYYRYNNNYVWSEWKQFAFTSGTTFLGETQFDSIKASGTIKSAGGQVSAADMEAFTAVQVNEAGQPLPPTFLADLENQITAMQAQITALQAQVEALTP